MNVVPRGALRFYGGLDKIHDTAQMVWQSRAEQSAYFATKVIGGIGGDNYSYIKHSGNAVKIAIEPNDFEKIARAEYCSFYNEGFEDFPWYCQVADWERVNNRTVHVTFLIDYFQTFWDRFEIDISQVIREGLSIADYNTLYDNPWADIPQMFTAEPLPSNLDLMNKPTVINANVGDDYDDLITKGFTSETHNAFNLNLSQWSCVIVAFNDEHGQGFSESPTVSQTLHIQANECATIAGTPGGRQGIYLNEIYNVIDDVKSETYQATPGATNNPLNIFNYPNPLYLVIRPFTNTGLKSINSILATYASEDLSSQVLGVYVMPSEVFMPSYNRGGLYTFEGATIEVPIINRTKSIGLSPKLLRSPYSYVRVTLPNGVSNSYPIELFTNMIGKGNDYVIDFLLRGGIYGLPTLSVIPARYKYGGSTPVNNNERMEINDFPEIPYVIDGYLQYNAMQRNSAYQNNSASLLNEKAKIEEQGMAIKYNEAQYGKIGTSLNALGGIGGSDGMLSVFKDGLSIAGDMVGQATYSAKMMLQGPQTAQAMDEIQNAARIQDRLLDVAKNEKERRAQGRSVSSDDMYTNLFGGPEAYLPDVYAPPAGNTGAYTLGQFFIKFEVVHLRNDIEDVYDDYFKMFGYSSEQLKKPYIYNWIQGSGTNANLPKWETEPDNNDWVVTYCKLGMCEISGVPEEASAWLRRMFQIGMRFYRQNGG